jgi:hypothetical protein
MNRVISLVPIEKPRQLRMVFGLLLMLRALPTALNDAVPLITAGPTGFACAAPAKQEATASATNFVRESGERNCNRSAIGDSSTCCISGQRQPRRQSGRQSKNTVLSGNNDAFLAPNMPC